VSSTRCYHFKLRLGVLLGTVASLLVATQEGRTEVRRVAHHASAAQKQKFLALDLTQITRCPEGLCAHDPQGSQWPLTLDVALQRNARRQLATSRPQEAALAAINVRTGKVIALAEWPQATSSDQSVLLRRFPAASLFKLVTSAALIENAHVPPDLMVCTQGGLHRLQEENLIAPQDGVAICNPFSEALGFSRNAAFAQLAHRYLTPEDLDNFADRFGFGSPLPLETRVDFGDFAAEVKPLNFARTATGFEGSTLSPLGAAYLAYVIANQGHTGRLQLLEVDSGTPPQPVTEFAAIRPETASIMHRMMELTVRRGTSWRAFHDAHGRPYLPHVSVAGKTGTLGDNDVTVSWFVGFAPSQNPEVAISVLLRNGELWHKKANEVARDWLREYFAQPRAQQPTRSAREKTRPRDAYANASEVHPNQ
jgi:penicillin-binding protein A